jgi:galactonate dehydratase
MFVKLTTNQGIVGYGEAMDAVRGTYGVATGTEGWDNMSQFLIGQNPLDVNKIVEQILRRGHFGGAQSGMFVAVLTGIEIALWDLAGKAMGQPIYRLMGGKFRDKIRLYCDTASSSESPEDMAAAALHVKNQGFTAIKFDIDWAEDPSKQDEFNRTASNGEVDRMVRQVAAVRDTIGMHMDLCLDAHGRYDLPSGIQIAKEMEPFKLMWLEEPIPAENLDALREITRQTTTPICTGENQYLAHDFRKILEKKAADVVMPDLHKCGGIGEGQRIANLANLYYVPVAPHMVASPFGAMAACHCCAAISNFLCLEWHWISRWKMWDELILEDPLIKDGYIHLSDQPGVGVTPNEEAIKKYAVKDAPFFS